MTIGVFHGSSLGFSVRAHWWFDLTHCSVWALQVSFGRRAFSARFCCSHPPSPFWRWGTLLGPHSIGAWGTHALQRHFVVVLLGGPRKEDGNRFERYWEAAVFSTRWTLTFVVGSTAAMFQVSGKKHQSGGGELVEFRGAGSSITLHPNEPKRKRSSYL